MVPIKFIALLASATAVLAAPHDGHEHPKPRKTITVTFTTDCPQQIPGAPPSSPIQPPTYPPPTTTPSPTWSVPTTGCAIPTTTTYEACDGHDVFTCPPVILCAIIEETTWSVSCVVPGTTSTVTGCTSTCQTGCATVTSTITKLTPPGGPAPTPSTTPSVSNPILRCSAPLTTTTPPCEGFDPVTCPPQIECLRLETTTWSVPCVGLETSTITQCQSTCPTDCPTLTETITVTTPGA